MILLWHSTKVHSFIIKKHRKILVLCSFCKITWPWRDKTMKLPIETKQKTHYEFKSEMFKPVFFRYCDSLLKMNLL